MLLGEVRFFEVAPRTTLLVTSSQIFGTGVVEVQLVTASHVALAVVHPAEGDGKDEGDDDNGGDEATHVLLNFLAAGLVTGGVARVLSGGEEAKRSLGLAGSVGLLSFEVGLIDPAAGAVVGGLLAFGLAGEEAVSANADAVGVAPGAEVAVEGVGRASSLGDVVGAEVLDAGVAVPDAGLDGVAELGLRGCAFALGAGGFDGGVPLAAGVGLAGVFLLEGEAVSRLARAGGVVPHAVVVVLVTFFDGAEAAETRDADTTFHLALVVGDARVFAGTVLGAAGRGFVGVALGADLEGGVEEAAVELAARSGVGGGGARSGGANIVAVVRALRIGVASGGVGVRALVGEAAEGSESSGSLAGDGSGVAVRAEETSGGEGDGLFGGPESVVVHHGEVDETVRDAGRVGGSEVGETLSGTNEVVTLEELGVGVERVLLPLPDFRALLLFTMATEPSVDAGSSEVVEEDGVTGGVGNADEATGSGSVGAGFAARLGLSVGHLAGGNVLDDGVAGAVKDGSNGGRSGEDLGVGDGAGGVAGRGSGEHDLSESSGSLGCVSVAGEAEGSVSFVPSDSEGSGVGVAVDEAVTGGVATDNSNSVTFNGVFDSRGGGEDLDGSGAGLEVTGGGEGASGGSSGAVSARLLGAGCGGVVGDEDAGRIRRAHQRADSVGAGLGSEGIVGVAHDLGLAVAGASEFAAEIGDAVAVGLALAEFLVLAGAVSGECASTSAVAGGLAGADVVLAGGGDGAEVEEAVRQRLAEEGVKSPGASKLALATVDVGVPAAFSGVTACSFGGAEEAGSGDGADGVAVGAVFADEVDRSVGPGRRISVLADVRLRARIAAGASSPHAEDAEAGVGESGEGRGLAEERATLSGGLPVLEGAVDGLAALDGRVAAPELQAGVVSPEPLAFFFVVVATDPAEAEELGADGVGVVHVADDGEAAGSSEEAAGLADRACAPPVDGTVGATEVHDLLGVGGKDVARAESPSDGTSGSAGSSGGETDGGEGLSNLSGREGRVLGGSDAELTLVAEPSGVELGVEGRNQAELINVLRVALLDGDDDGLGRETRGSTREGNSLEGLSSLPSRSRSDGLPSHVTRLDVRVVDAVASGLSGGEARDGRGALGSGRAAGEEPDAVGISIAGAFVGVLGAILVGGSRVVVALVLVPLARSGNSAVLGGLELRAVADGEAAALLFLEGLVAGRTVADGLGEDSALACGDTFADRGARRPGRPLGVLAVLRARLAASGEEVPGAGRVQQAVITSGGVARLDVAGSGGGVELASSLVAARGRAGSGVARRRSAR